MTRGKWVHPEERLCDECGLSGLEPSYRSTRTMHIACAKARRSRHANRLNPVSLARERAWEAARRDRARDERYATDPAYREYCDVVGQHGLRGRPDLEALSSRDLWTRY